MKLLEKKKKADAAETEKGAPIKKQRQKDRMGGKPAQAMPK